MTYRLFVKQEATQDAKDGYEWYEKSQRGLGKKFLDEIDRYLLRITQSPHQFPRDRSQRIAVLKKFPYKITFDIEENLITVYSIYHDKRDHKKLSVRRHK